MGASTGIEWTDATWNPVGGCSIASPGCANCYAQSLAGGRLKSHPLYAGTTDTVKRKHVFNGHLTVAPFDHPVWTWPLRWRGAKQPKLGPGKPSMIFVGDMSDLFHEDRPDEIIDRVFAVAACSPHILQFLTKRAERMREYVTARCEPRKRWPLPNVHLGVSVERQQEADERIPHLLATPAAVRFVSCEPLLGPIDLENIDYTVFMRSIRPGSNAGLHPLDPAIRYDVLRGHMKGPDDIGLPKLDQVIVGGESGRDARPMHPQWARSLRDQCQAAGTAFFFKQWGEWRPFCGAAIDEARGNGMPDIAWPDGTICWGICEEHGGRGQSLEHVGKARAGRLLDGREWNEFPANHVRGAA